MPLKGIPKIIGPELLYNLARMGHGDEIVLADAHFPTSSVCRAGGAVEIRADGISSIVQLVSAILVLFPLDQYVERPIAMMQLVDQDWDRFDDHKPPIYKDICRSVSSNGTEPTAGDATLAAEKINLVERFAFYERAKSAFAIVHTGEVQPYANVILKKGVHIS